MVCDICKDAVFLAQKAAPATAEDLGAAHMRPRRAACLCPARGKPNGFKPSRCSGKMSASSPAARPLPAGRRRSSSTRSTTVKEF